MLAGCLRQDQPICINFSMGSLNTSYGTNQSLLQKRKFALRAACSLVNYVSGSFFFSFAQLCLEIAGVSKNILKSHPWWKNLFLNNIWLTR